MARPQQSPRMRDHWRDEGHRRDHTNYRGRQRDSSLDRRSSPVAAEKRERSIGVEVKIKGRATVEETHRHSSHIRDSDTSRKPSPYTKRQPSHSPHRRRQREGSYEHRRGVDDHNYRNPSYHRKIHRQHLDDRRSSRSRSPHRAAAPSYRDRRRSPNHYHSRQTDSETDTRTKYRGPHRSRPKLTPRADHRPAHSEKPSLAADTYIPAARLPRSRSPASRYYREPLTHNRRSPVPRSTRPRNSHRSYEDDELISYYRTKSREQPPRATSRESYQKVAQPRRSRAHSRGVSQGPAKRQRSSRSPSENVRFGEENRMQSTHRIQVLDSTSRPQSPPRPIPSFDTNSQASGSYPMHANRAGRLQVNTQHPHSASPQWTPTSSHHGSPQSASPYAHGRGGWTGQPQQYQSQPG